MASQLTDAFARKFYYLRLSITDVCNFRCTYCLPDGYKPSGVTNKGFLTCLLYTSPSPRDGPFSRMPSSG